MSLARVPSEHCKFGIFNANFPECGAEICNEPLYIYMCILHVHAILSAKKTRMQTIYESVPKSQSSHGNFFNFVYLAATLSGSRSVAFSLNSRYY